MLLHLLLISPTYAHLRALCSHQARKRALVEAALLLMLLHPLLILPRALSHSCALCSHQARKRALVEAALEEGREGADAANKLTMEVGLND